jgi:hypothetical protein
VALLAAMMRRGLAIGLLIGVVLGTGLGVVVSDNFYEYHVVVAGRDDVPQMVNQQGWEPLPGNQGGSTLFLRRPHIRLGG